MTALPTAPIPVTILTGFLGAGKTTLLNHLLHADHGLRVAVIVNDFGAINIDAQLVVGVEGEGEGDTLELSNGCICCTLRTDLLRTAVDLLARPVPPEYIIVETSGVSDPASVASTFMMPELRSFMRVDSILTVVDAEQVRTLDNENYFLAMEQLGVADIVILNKIDLLDAKALAEVRNWIHDIVPRARILETTQAQVPTALVLGVGEYDADRLAQRKALDVHVHPAGEDDGHDHDGDSHSHDHATVFETWNWTSDQPVSYRALRRVMEHLPLAIYRAKGFLYMSDMPDQKAVLHVVGKRVSLSLDAPWGDDEVRRSQVVVIGAYGRLDPADLQLRFDGTLAQNAAAGDLSRMADTVFSWLRKSKGIDKA